MCVPQHTSRRGRPRVRGKVISQQTEEEVITSIPTLTTHRELQLVEFMVRLESQRRETQRRDLNLGWGPQDPRA